MYITIEWNLIQQVLIINTSSSSSVHTLALPIQIALIFTTHTQVNCLVFNTSGNNITYKVENLKKK